MLFQVDPLWRPQWFGWNDDHDYRPGLITLTIPAHEERAYPDERKVRTTFHEFTGIIGQIFVHSGFFRPGQRYRDIFKKEKS
jgi:hypothetical protein